MLLWQGVLRSQELSADQDVIPARLGIGWVDGYIYKRWHQHTWTTEDEGGKIHLGEKSMGGPFVETGIIITASLFRE